MKKTLVASLCGLLLSGCIASGPKPLPILNPFLQSLETKINYDNSNTKVLESEIELALRSTYEVKISSEFQITIGEIVINSNMETSSTATPIWEKDNFIYFLTAMHVVSDKSIPLTQEYTDLIEAESKRLNEKPEIKATSKILMYSPYLDKEFEANDSYYEPLCKLGVIRMPSNEYVKPIPFKIDKNSSMHIGDYVYNLGYPVCLQAVTPSMNSGHIVSIKPLLPSLYPNYIIDNHINPGDSGGPVYALKNGHLTLVGVMEEITGTTLTTYGVFNPLLTLDALLEFSSKP